MTTQTLSIEDAFKMCLNRIALLEHRANSLQRAQQDAVANATRLRKRICSLEATDAVRREGRAISQPVEFVSQFGEDAVIWALLGCPLKGYFVEVGAYDGKNLSVSLALEQMGWTGLLVEPIPERAALCKLNRPGSKVVHAALGGKDAHGETTFTVTDDQWGSLLSFRGEATAHHRKKLEFESATERTISVPLENLANLLEGCTDHVDAAIIDVEGSEVEVLQGMNLAKYRPRVMVIEDDLATSQTELMKFMSGLPDYKQVGTVGCNRVFIHSCESEILARVAMVSDSVLPSPVPETATSPALYPPHALLS